MRLSRTTCTRAGGSTSRDRGAVGVHGPRATDRGRIVRRRDRPRRTRDARCAARTRHGNQAPTLQTAEADAARWHERMTRLASTRGTRFTRHMVQLYAALLLAQLCSCFFSLSVWSISWWELLSVPQRRATGAPFARRSISLAEVRLEGGFSVFTRRGGMPVPPHPFIWAALDSVILKSSWTAASKRAHTSRNELPAGAVRARRGWGEG